MGDYDVMRALNDQQASHFAGLQEQYERYYEQMARDMLAVYEWARVPVKPAPAVQVDPYEAGRNHEALINRGRDASRGRLDQRIAAAQVRDDYDGPESLPNWED